MTNKMSWYFEVNEEAGWALNEDGSKTSCYLEYKMEFENAVDDSEVTMSYEEQAILLAKEIAKEFQFPEDWLRPISKAEYILHTEDTSEGSLDETRDIKESD